jgi:hypothetical protein
MTNRATDKDWESARLRWESDVTLTFGDVAGPLGVSKQRVAQKARSDGWERAKPKMPKRIGRPTSYRPEYDEQAQRLAMLGLTNEEMAIFFNVSPSTLSKWIAELPAFSEALKAGRQVADAKVTESLFKRATGYTCDEDDIRTVSLPNNGGSQIVITPTKKHYPPDPTSMIFWLKNRQPRKWRDRVDDGPQTGPIPIRIVRAAKPPEPAADD